MKTQRSDEDTISNMANAPRNRRTGVAAESFDPNDPAHKNRKKIVHPKSQEQVQRLTKVAKSTILLGQLDDEELKEVIDAMFERKVKPKEVVIEQGESGNNFYVVDTGEYDIFIKDQAGKSSKVSSCKNNGSFGELALMYDTPRAATVIANTNGTLWGLDRDTFRCIVLASTYKRRKLFENALAKVSLLKQLNNHERMNVADSLKIATFSDKSVIFKQGEDGKEMYFILEGKVKVMMKKDGKSEELMVNTLKEGDYFGELSLITNMPRAASVYAEGKVKLGCLCVDSFERLLGPCINIMKRNISDYEKQLKTLFGKDVPKIRK